MKALTLRLDEKTRYGLDLVSRKLNNSLQGSIVYLLKDGVKKQFEEEDGASFLEEVFHPNEAMQFLKLATSYSYLFTEEQERIQKFIFDHKEFWTLTKENSAESLFVDGEYVVMHWEVIKKCAKKGCSKSLPENPRSPNDYKSQLTVKQVFPVHI